MNEPSYETDGSVADMTIQGFAQDCVRLEAEVIMLKLIVRESLTLIQEATARQEAQQRTIDSLREEIRRYTASKVLA